MRCEWSELNLWNRASHPRLSLLLILDYSHVGPHSTPSGAPTPRTRLQHSHCSSSRTQLAVQEGRSSPNFLLHRCSRVQIGSSPEEATWSVVLSLCSTAARTSADQRRECETALPTIDPPRWSAEQAVNNILYNSEFFCFPRSSPHLDLSALGSWSGKRAEESTALGALCSSTDAGGKGEGTGAYWRGYKQLLQAPDEL